MLSECLSEDLPVEEYFEIPNNKIFFGSKVKHLYDEKRINIDVAYNPKRLKINKECFYGVLFDILPEYRSLLTDLKFNKFTDIIGYSNLLKKYNLTCENCFYDLQPPVYPVDYLYISKFLPDFRYEKFIKLDTEIPPFQAITSLVLYIVKYD